MHNGLVSMLSPSLGTLLQILLLWWNFRASPWACSFFCLGRPPRSRHRQSGSCANGLMLRRSVACPLCVVDSMFFSDRCVVSECSRSSVSEAALLYFAFASERFLPI